jgi:gamma-glutamylcyclotransferase (GGCT)/AIG2-like uncharacterized protein YtfP
MSINNKIFVYGTLREGLLEKVLPEVSNYIQKKRKGAINARLFDLGEYPAAKPTRIKARKVHGLLYEVDPRHLKEVLQQMDDYEEYDPGKKQNSLYVRRMTEVTDSNGSLSKAWVYWYNRPVKTGLEINTGDYMKYLKQNKAK